MSINIYKQKLRLSTAALSCPHHHHKRQEHNAMALDVSNALHPSTAIASDDAPTPFPFLYIEAGDNSWDTSFLATQAPDALLDLGVSKVIAWQATEKQISVDPKSLKESSSSSIEMARTCPPLPIASVKPRFSSVSLPSSATSSPRSGSSLLKKIWRKQIQASPVPANYTLDLRQKSLLRRSKSCDEGRCHTPSEDLDLWLISEVKGKDGHENQHCYSNSISLYRAVEANEQHLQKGKVDSERFTCGALCLYLPGFGKGKPVRSKKERGAEAEIGNMAFSRTVSLEKFDCGSWSSSARLKDREEDGGSSSRSANLYFDLPLELIRSSANDVHSPVTTAFMFDNKDQNRKGVLKNSGRATGPEESARRSHDTSRHVRFSTSTSPGSPSSTCITPRLRKAREDFNAFLEAQSA